jgi:cbb3-type cytochrome oxidase subunit 3
MIKILFALALMTVIWFLFVKPRRKLPNIAEAHAILGLGDEATVDDVKAAHRRLVSGVHPDRGGSAELTRRINDARDVLLRRLT